LKGAFHVNESEVAVFEKVERDDGKSGTRSGVTLADTLE
jgi:hypothetical protein